MLGIKFDKKFNFLLENGNNHYFLTEISFVHGRLRGDISVILIKDLVLFTDAL